MMYFRDIAGDNIRKFNRMRYMMWVYLPMIKSWNVTRFNNNNRWTWTNDSIQDVLDNHMSGEQGKIGMNIVNHIDDYTKFLSVKVNGYNTDTKYGLNRLTYPLDPHY